MSHPCFNDEVNRNIAQSEIEGGVHLDDISDGTVLEIETQHHSYRIVNRSGGEALISGHPNYCPEPVPVRIAGSTWGGSMLKLRSPGAGCTSSSAIPPTTPSPPHLSCTSGQRLEKMLRDD